MDTGATSKLRAARRRAGLSQEAVAARIGTSQPAVARLESRAADPRLGTVERYLAAVGATLAVVPQAPQSSLAQAGEGVKSALRRDDPDEALRHVVQVIDDLQGASTEAVVEAVRDEPEPTGSRRWDAMLAGVGEYLCRRRQVRVPGWTAAPSRFLDEFWFVVGDVLGRVPAGLACVALVESPPELANRGVLLDQTALASV